MNIDACRPERIAYRSTEGDGSFAKKRFVELAVYFLHEPPIGGDRFVAEKVRRSTVEGERTIRTARAARDLEQALSFFDYSLPAKAVIGQARDWLAAHPELVEPAPFTGGSDLETLAWLYGKDEMAKRGFWARFAADFGIGESKARMAIKRGNPIRVDLSSVAGLIDRAAFQRASAIRRSVGGGEKIDG